jgi:hypothetical protein
MSILSAVDCGTLHIIKEADRSSALDVNDTSVGDTWEEADFSSMVPNGTKAILVNMFIYTTSSNDKSMLLIRSGDSSDTNTTRTRVLRVRAQLGASGLGVGAAIIIRAENGIFDYRRYSSTYPITSVQISLHGYYL